MLKARPLLLYLLFLLIVRPQGIQAEANRGPASPVVSVNASEKSFGEGTLQWALAHRVVFQGKTATSVRVPYIDLYSPTGVSVYFEEDPTKNAAFLRALPGDLPQGSVAKTDKIRPTLQEAMGMVPELKPYEGGFLGGNEYTVFAVTFPDSTSARCKAQNEAVQKLKSRAGQIRLHVIEVRLHLDNEPQ